MLAALTGIPVVGPFLAMAFSPVGRWIVLAVALLVWLGFHDAKVADRARSECQAAQLQKTIAELTRQRDAAREALDDAEKQQVVTDKEMADLEKQRDDAVAKARKNSSKRPAGKRACDVPSADLDGVRNIR